MDNQEPNNQLNIQTPKSKKKNFSLDYRIIIIILLVIIGIMLALWRPWSAPLDDNRTITVKGTSTIQSEPDEYVFHPTYKAENTDKSKTLTEITKKTEDVVEGVKKLGVEDKDIESDTSGYERLVYYRDSDSGKSQYISRLTITAHNREMAQKVQDYLITTSPTGSISPDAQFSDAKRKELEDQARTEATKDAKQKADQMANELDFKLLSVKSIDSHNNVIREYHGLIDTSIDAGASLDSTEGQGLSVQPGQNDLNYSFSVTYYIN